MFEWDDLNHKIVQPICETEQCQNLKHVCSLFTNNDNFKIFHHNIRSLRKHFDEICIILNELNFCFDIIILTETHLLADEPFNIPGFSTHYFNSLHTAFDGMIVFINSERIKNAKIVREDSVSSANAATISFMIFDESYSVLALYRSPSTNTKLFIDELNAYVTAPQTTTHQFLIGDINLNILESAQNLNNAYLNILYTCG